MSFQDLQRENVGNRSSRAPSQSQGVAAGIFQINTAVSGFRRLVDAIGTSKDTPDHRQKLHATTQRILQLVKETSAKLKSVSQSDRGANANPNKRIEDAKLARDFQTTLQEFQKVQQLASERESMFSPSFPPSSSGTVSDSGDIQHLVSNKGMNHFLWNKRAAAPASNFQVPGGAAPRRQQQASKASIQETAATVLLQTLKKKKVILDFVF
ncbi:hypothetical protein M9H77_37023 [Catharanthus roseus]|uniref:Uncharacterized protein n=1 Tax=Catharanthus roseus TaxID=4058 RepID=A0ACB9ZTU8_CATRO|nr:hypothetical protein M9H77_37023 [Catharanthus roseus]